MNTKDLKCFQTVYEECSLNRAAKKLYITPQGLSKNIKMLENELDTVLFLRTRQGLTPTQSARFLYQKADAVISQLEEIQAGLRQLENQEILLRIGCACGVFNAVPFQLVQEFTRANPGIRVQWCEYSNREVEELLESSNIEYGFMVGNCGKAGLAGRKLASRRLLLLVYQGHPLYQRETVNIDLLKGENLLLMNEHFQMFHDIHKVCQARGFTPNVVAKTADGPFLYKLCTQNMGLAVVPDFMADDFKMEHLRAIPFEEELLWEVFGVYKEDNRSYATTRAFDEFLKEHL